jgi:hypothetical protein
VAVIAAARRRLIRRPARSAAVGSQRWHLTTSHQRVLPGPDVPLLDMRDCGRRSPFFSSSSSSSSGAREERVKKKTRGGARSIPPSCRSQNLIAKARLYSALQCLLRINWQPDCSFRVNW